MSEADDLRGLERMRTAAWARTEASKLHHLSEIKAMLKLITALLLTVTVVGCSTLVCWFLNK